MRAPMPIACSTSALRRLASASALRAVPAIAAAVRRLAGAELGQQRQPDEQDRADQCGDADPEVEQEADREIERHPRQVEQRRRPEARQEAADLIEVAQRLQAVARACRALSGRRTTMSNTRRARALSSSDAPMRDRARARA